MSNGRGGRQVDDALNTGSDRGSWASAVSADVGGWELEVGGRTCGRAGRGKTNSLDKPQASSLERFKSRIPRSQPRSRAHVFPRRVPRRRRQPSVCVCAWPWCQNRRSSSKSTLAIDTTRPSAGWTFKDIQGHSSEVSTRNIPTSNRRCWSVTTDTEPSEFYPLITHRFS